MPRTKPDTTGQLTPEQETALDLILAGQSDREVACEVNRTRQTICEWRHNPVFAAALNTRRTELWGHSIDRLRGLLPKALDVLEGALDKGDVRTAWRVVELASMREDKGLGPSTIGPTSPEGVAAEQVMDSLVSGPFGSSFGPPDHA